MGWRRRSRGSSRVFGRVDAFRGLVLEGIGARHALGVVQEAGIEVLRAFAVVGVYRSIARLGARRSAVGDGAGVGAGHGHRTVWVFAVGD